MHYYNVCTFIVNGGKSHFIEIAGVIAALVVIVLGMFTL